MTFKASFGFFLFLTVFFPSVFGLQITGFSIQNTGGYTNDSTPAMTIITDSTTPNNDTMQFSCDGTTFSSFISYTQNFSNSANDFDIKTGAGCNGQDGLKDINVHVLDSDLNENAWRTAQVTLDTTVEISGITINNGSANTKSASPFPLSLNNPNPLDFSGTQSCQVITEGSDANYAVDGNAWHIPWVPASEGNKDVNVHCTDIHQNTRRFFGSLFFDTTAPTVSISSPANNATITSSSTVTIQYAGSDSGSGMSKYWVSSNGASWINNSLNTTYSFSGQSNGSHTYYVIANDLADNNSAATNVTVTVNVIASPPPTTPPPPGGGDSTPPLGEWKEPLDGNTVSGTVLFHVEATDPSGIKEVEFFLDSTANLLAKVITRTNFGFEFEWDSTITDNGEHQLLAVVRDYANNAKTLVITVTVQNNETQEIVEQNETTGAQSTESVGDLQERLVSLQSRMLLLKLVAELNSNASAAESLNQVTEVLLEVQTQLQNEQTQGIAEKLDSAKQILDGLDSELNIALFEAFDARPLNAEAFLSKTELEKGGLTGELAAWFDQTRGLAASSREIFVFARKNEDGSQSFLVKMVVKIKNVSASTQEFVLIERVPK